MKITDIVSESLRTENPCWKGYHPVGTKKKNGRTVPNCVPGNTDEGVEEDTTNNPEYTDEVGYVKDNLHTIVRVCKMLNKAMVEDENLPDWVQEKVAQAKGMLVASADYLVSQHEQGRVYTNSQQGVAEAGSPAQQAAIAINMKKHHDKPKSLDEQFDIIEEMIEQLAEEHGVDSEVIWEDFEAVDDETLLEVAAWQKKSGKNRTGGLNRKGVASYRREHPGSKLQTAVTTKPSKLKPGSKAAKRRKSFCARMGGMKGPMKDANGKPTRKALALRKWNC